MLRLPSVTDAPSFWRILEAEHGTVAFDIGANIGQAATVLAAHFKHVYSYEPCNESASILLTETPLNVVVIPKAMSNGPCNIDLDVTDNAFAYGQLTTGSKLGWGKVVYQRNVAATTVDSEVDRLGMRPDLVKVDTEGHEVKVLQGAKHTLSTRHAVWLIEVHDRSFEDQLRDLLAGYRIERFDHDYLHGSPQAADHYYLVARPL